jgi:hypothetical protein
VKVGAPVAYELLASVVPEPVAREMADVAGAIGMKQTFVSTQPELFS